MNLHEMAEKVDSKESFLRFVQALAEDAAAAHAESDRTPDGKLNLSPRGWENGASSHFSTRCPRGLRATLASRANRWFRSMRLGVLSPRSCTPEKFTNNL